MRLILVRHAQSLHNLLVTQMPREEFDRIRTADPELTPLGLEQADALGAHLAGYLADLAPADTVIRTSPMLRTLQTARPLLATHGSRSLLWLDIHELGGLFVGVPAQGTAEGRPGIGRAELGARFPEFTPSDEHGDHGWWDRDVESELEFLTRVESVAATLRGQARGTTDDDLLVLVSHGTFLNRLLLQLVPEKAAELNHHHNAAFSELLVGDAGISLVRHDVTDHLGEDMLTV